MARRAQTAGNAHRAADIRSAIDEFDECRHGNVIEMAARADEFSDAALGAQRVPNDRHIDTDLLWSWFQEQLMKADGKLRDAQDMSDLDAGADPRLHPRAPRQGPPHRHCARRGRAGKFRSLCTVLGLEFYVGPPRQVGVVDEQRLEAAVEATERALEEGDVPVDLDPRDKARVPACRSR